ncbi:MAG: DUF3467 domain-containing protein [Nitrospirae bacterium]|nr:MAG: DUF3467 domain-containing protein [Nitrospirota bacterium]
MKKTNGKKTLSERKTQVATKVEDKEIIKAIQVPIKWNIPEGLNSFYSSNMMVQLLENEFKLLFFETKPQLRINENEPLEQEVRSDCFASIIVSPAKIPGIINVLQRQYDLYKKRIEVQKLDSIEKVDTKI